MDADILRAKLESLARCIKRIEGRRPVSAKALADDLDAQDIISLNLERAVQLCVVTTRLGDFRDFASTVLARLEEPSSD